MANPKSIWTGVKDHGTNKSIAVQLIDKSMINKIGMSKPFTIRVPSYLKGWTQASHVVVPSTNIVDKCITCNCLYPSDSRSYSLFWDYLETTNLSSITDMSSTTKLQWDPRDFYDSDLSEQKTKLVRVSSSLLLPENYIVWILKIIKILICKYYCFYHS
jgi:hypothetical protein